MADGCSLTGDYTRICELVEIGSGREFTVEEQQQFGALANAWGEGECAVDCYSGGQCPYVRWTTDAIQYLGYTNLHDVLYRLFDKADLNRLLEIPAVESIDALSAKWARQPGHLRG